MSPSEIYLGSSKIWPTFGVKNICLHLNRPKNSHLGQLLYIKGSLKLIRTYWAEIAKMDIFATIRTYWAQALKEKTIAEI